MTTTNDARPAGLVARRVAALSTDEPFRVPPPEPGRRVVHLTSGGPAAEALPVDDLAAGFDAALRRDAGRAGLAYSDSPGLPRLRDVLAVREGVPASRVVVTNGALHGISLAFAAVLDPGDVVLVEDPVFSDTVRIVENAGGVAVGVPVDADGLDVDAVERVVLADRTAGRRVKCVYTVPDYQNPSGAVLSAARRERLVALAERYDLLVVSDNPYRLHGFDAVPVPDLPDSDRVLRVSTFSKTLGPGLRLGHVVAPGWLAPHLVNLRRRVDFHSHTLTQHVVADLLERDGWFDAMAAGAREVYRRRARTLVRSLREHTADVLEFTDPVGGFFVWARVVAPGVSARALAAAAGQAGFVLPDGSPFAVSGDSPAHGFVRLAYSQAAIDDLAASGPALAAAAAGLRGPAPSPRR
jgi:2-aminoadipate transaminase